MKAYLVVNMLASHNSLTNYSGQSVSLSNLLSM